MTPIRIATRASRLALVQAQLVARAIEKTLGVATELRPMRTSGDRLARAPLAQFGGKGLFVKEIEEALLDGNADVAVHSAKDLPAKLPPGLVLVAFAERADPRDALVSRQRGARLATLAPNARVGTGSVRRTAQLRSARPDLRVVPLRGNVTTRLSRLDSGDLDALVLACAGLDRLGFADRIEERIDASVLLPAVGQGVLALETREEDPLANELAGVSHPATARAFAAERAFLSHLEGDCNVPLAALAAGGASGPIRLRGLVASSDGSRIARGEAEGESPEAVGATAADVVLGRGGSEILLALRAERAS